jgi:hypothetical protein
VCCAINAAVDVNVDVNVNVRAKAWRDYVFPEVGLVLSDFHCLLALCITMGGFDR